MKRIPFDLQHRSQIESGEYKVVTEMGEPVEIVKWNCRGRCPILAVIDDGDTDDCCFYKDDGVSLNGADSLWILIEETPKQKEIYFCVDIESYTKQMLDNRGAVGYYDYIQASHAISIGITPIVTSQLALMTFYLKEIACYDVYICYKEKKIKIEECMQLSDSGYCLSCPSCCEDSDILDVFKEGYFNDLLGIKEE